MRRQESDEAVKTQHRHVTPALLCHVVVVLAPQAKHSHAGGPDLRRGPELDPTLMSGRAL